MKNRIALKSEPRRTVIVFLTFTLTSLLFIIALAFSVNKDCVQLNSLFQSGYDYSAVTQEPVFENEYYQFNAGLDFALSNDSQTSLNADIIMQTSKSTYTDLVYWNANILGTHGIAVSKNLVNMNDLNLGDELYSKHIVNGEVVKYTIEQIIPETVCIRADKGKSYSNGIIIMGYDAEYVDNITHNCIVFTDENINELTAKCMATPQDIIYRDDEMRRAILSIVTYLAFFSLIAVAVAIISVYILKKGIACNFRRLIMLGFEKKRLNHAYRDYIHSTSIASIIISLAISSIIFLFVDITAVRIIIIICVPLIELITIFIATATSNRRLWRK